jgi:hypothetical protein
MPNARYLALIASTLLVCQTASAQVIERELGDFSLKLGTTPSRTMAQGPATAGWT